MNTLKNHCQHIVDFYSPYTWVSDDAYISWDNAMRDALGVERLSLDTLINRLHPVLKCRKFPSIDKRTKPVQ